METVEKPNTNPALAPFTLLLGRWKVEMKHVAIPDPLSWEDSFEWLTDGFIMWHWQGKNDVPKATFIIGRNERSSGALYNAFYYDSRGVSRVFEVTFENGIYTFMREGNDFYQRFAYTIRSDGNSMTGIGELSEDKGENWKHDFSITYTRIL